MIIHHPFGEWRHASTSYSTHPRGRLENPVKNKRQITPPPHPTTQLSSFFWLQTGEIPCNFSELLLFNHPVLCTGGLRFYITYMKPKDKQKSTGTFPDLWSYLCHINKLLKKKKVNSNLSLWSWALQNHCSPISSAGDIWKQICSRRWLPMTQLQDMTPLPLAAAHHPGTASVLVILAGSFLALPLWQGEVTWKPASCHHNLPKTLLVLCLSLRKLLFTLHTV